LAPEADAAARAHLATCGSCRTLVRELDVIRARAAALPALEPPRDVWAGIDARIRAAGAAGAARPAHRARDGRTARWFGTSWSRAGLARAAALVLATAAVTTFATHRLWHGPSAPAGTSGPAVALAPGAGGPSAAVAHPAGAVSEPPRAATPRNQGPVTAAPGVGTTIPVARANAPTLEFVYDQQIGSLHRILEQRRNRLDPKTVAVIERNLAVIDSAISESKAALAKDPANAFLAQQVDHALDSKVELLRTVAMLPSRT
jgi:hypothetical protein